jgi:excisionase family DNA binding protein
MADTTDEFMTVAEIASILRLNQQTIRNWIDAGKLPALHIGRRVRICRSDFDQLVANSYSGASVGDNEPAAVPNIWDGEIPPPSVP